jgi:hypothetical protein
MQPDQHLQQRRHLSRVVGCVVFRETRHEAAQQSDDVFRAFDVAAQPEEILGDAARQLGGGGFEVDRIERRKQANRADWTVGDYSRVLAPAAALH